MLLYLCGLEATLLISAPPHGVKLSVLYRKSSSATLPLHIDAQSGSPTANSVDSLTSIVPAASCMCFQQRIPPDSLIHHAATERTNHTKKFCDKGHICKMACCRGKNWQVMTFQLNTTNKPAPEAYQQIHNDTCPRKQNRMLA